MRWRGDLDDEVGAKGALSHPVDRLDSAVYGTGDEFGRRMLVVDAQPLIAAFCGNEQPTGDETGKRVCHPCCRRACSLPNATRSSRRTSYRVAASACVCTASRSVSRSKLSHQAAVLHYDVERR